MTTTEAERPAVSVELYRALMGGPRTHAAQTGFGWSCALDGHDDSGADRGEYAGHMASHGRKAPAPSVKRIKLRKAAPVAKLPALEVNVFKWAHWTQEHTEPGTCECGHKSTDHASWQGNDGITVKCGDCGCIPGPYGLPKPTDYNVDRRGQYLANGPQPHSVWVIPFEPAPWESSKAEPVLLYVGKAGRYFTEAYSAKWDRR